MHDSVPFDPSHADTEEVCQWLQAGLDGYLGADVGRWAFCPLERYIGVGEDLADDIQAIYDTLIPDAQGRWRSAIRNLIAMHGQDPSKRESTGVLVDLAALIRAYEVLDVLPNLLPCEELLFHQVLRTAISLARQVDAAHSCLEYIRTTPSFPAAYAGHVLIALCRVTPDDWLTHVRGSAPQMRALANRLPEDSTALRYYASAILETISVRRAIASLPKLVGNPECQWLWYEWLHGTSPLLMDDDYHIELMIRLTRANVEYIGQSIKLVSHVRENTWLLSTSLGERHSFCRETQSFAPTRTPWYGVIAPTERWSPSQWPAMCDLKQFAVVKKSRSVD